MNGTTYRENRRGLRILLNLLHILLQGIYLYIVVGIVGPRQAGDLPGMLGIVKSLLLYLCVMFGTFYIYYSFYKLLTDPNRRRSTDRM
jgi:phosphoglycerol transferase MdoB-like AlkP superfamily enzyme